MSDPIVIRSYPDRLHAELARSVLESEGVFAQVTTPSQLPGSYMIAEWGDGFIPHELRVVKEDMDAAEAILGETERGDWEVDEDGETVGAGNEEEAALVAAVIPTAADPGTDAETCHNCGGPTDRDDGFFYVLRRALFGIGVATAGVAVLAAVWVNAGTPAGILDYVINIALAAFGTVMALFVPGLFVRAFFVRTRCGYCGRHRLSK